MKKTLLSIGLLSYCALAWTQIIPTEIMYNAPGTGGNDLEFIELYNAGSETIALEGYQLSDAGNFTFVFPAMDLAPSGIVLLATNKDVADVFYGVSFLDLPGAGNFLGNGGELIQLLDNNSQVVFAVTYDDASPWTTAPDGGGPSLELTDISADPTNGANWAASSIAAGTNGGFSIFASPGVFTPLTTSFVAFDEEFIVVNENAGSALIPISLSILNPTGASVTVSPGSFATAEEGTDFTFAETVVSFDDLTGSTVEIAIPVLDNMTESADRLFTLTLSNPVNCELGEVTTFVVYILDDEETAPVATESLGLEFIGSYLVDAEGSAEIVAYNSARKRLYAMNSTGVKLEIIDFSDPANPFTVNTIDLSAYGSGGTSVACNNKYVAVTVDGFDNEPGSVVIFTWNGIFRNQLTAGYLPDMLAFTPNNRFLVIANEGEPSADYSFDPEGSISVIYMLGNVAALDDEDVIHIDFNDFDDDIEALRADGVRIFGLNATVSQDVEPEYITFSQNSNTAWVTLQENNAVAKVNMQSFQVEAILPLGLKDHALDVNSLDLSDRNDSVFMASWNHVKGMYLPDAIASYKVGNTTYLVTANEGDQREYDEIDEDVAVGDSNYQLDPTAFPEAEVLKADHLLGRLVVTPYSGDTDGDGDYDEIHCFGARSFSIWNGTTGALVYDSGDDFEKITANDPVYGGLFNANNTSNAFKNRSDNKGPEPEGVTVAKINETWYAFITLERTGGILVYDITNPEAPVFEAYRNSRDLNSASGDLGPEGIIFISAENSPNDTALVVIANEISATVSVYALTNVTEAGLRMAEATAENESGSEITDKGMQGKSLQLYPNPVAVGGIVFMSEPTSYQIFSSDGKLMLTANNRASIDTSGLAAGIYLLVTNSGEQVKLVIE